MKAKSQLPVQSMLFWARAAMIVLTGAIAPWLRAETITVVTPAGSEETVRLAARELVTHLQPLYPADRFVESDQVPATGKSILVADVSRHRDAGAEIDLSKLTVPDSYVVAHRQETGRELGVVVGAGRRGPLFGVYAILRRLGWEYLLSGDIAPRPRAEPFDFKAWSIANAPLVRDRALFNWHNFLTSCSTWNLPDWETWMTQGQKMGFNGVIVHAYGNSPLTTFSFNGINKDVGNLSTTVRGRDWGTQHVNDVRRLWGGFVFDGPVFGAEAALVPDDQATPAARALMQGVFRGAKRRGMDIYLAFDIDTISGNPQPMIQSLPVSARFRVTTLRAGTESLRLPEVWLADPDTPEGFDYYRAQVNALLATYPDVDYLVGWCREARTPLTDLTEAEMPESWQRQFRESLKGGAAGRERHIAEQAFAIAKIVRAMQRVLAETGRRDVQIATGSWGFEFLPSLDRVLPPDIKFIALDSQILNDQSQLRDSDSRKAIRDVAEHRPVLPVVWTQHDDGRHLGRPFTPFAEFGSKLLETRSSGFAVIHWLTRPHDLYFLSLGRQVWSATRDERLEETCKVFATGVDPAHGEQFGSYLASWLTDSPMFARETGPRLFDRPMADVEVAALAGIARRQSLLSTAAAQTPAAKTQMAFFQAYENFTVGLLHAEVALEKTRALYRGGKIADARKLLSSTHPETVVQDFARLSADQEITRGEQGLVVSLNLRWLPYFAQMRQILRLEPVRYRFAPTSHDPLAQGLGRSTYYFDPAKTMWLCAGTKETGRPVTTSTMTKVPADTTDAEIYTAGIRIESPTEIHITPFLLVDGAEDLSRGILSSKTSGLSRGKYRLEFLHLNDPGSGTNRVGLHAEVRAKYLDQESMVSLAKSDFRSNLKGPARSSLEIDLARDASLAVELTPLEGHAVLCGIVVVPLDQ